MNEGVKAGLGEASAPIVRLLIVSDVLLYREAIESGLAGTSSMRVVGHCRAADTIVQLAAVRADVVLMDASAPAGLALAHAIHSEHPAMRIIGIAIGNDARDLLNCAEAGLCGFVGNSVGFRGLVVAIERALHGELSCSPTAVGLLFRHIGALAASQRPAAAEPCELTSVQAFVARDAATAAGLTRREDEVARLIGGGLTNKEIALRLRISAATVKNHVHNILDKLQAPRRAAIRSQVEQQ
jgi:two-component system nitrate/nitrite response regulator NarL